VHPLPLAPRRDDASAAEVSQMSGNLGLRAAQNLHKITDTDLLISHEIQKPETGVVTESLEEAFHVKALL
jgi:hypothetical protein